MPYIEYQVSAIPIDNLLTEVIDRYKMKVQYMNSDIEGADEDVLLSIDPAVYGVEVLQFENNREFAGSIAMRLHLAKCGYRHFATLGGIYTYVINDVVFKRFPGSMPSV